MQAIERGRDTIRQRLGMVIMAGVVMVTVGIALVVALVQPSATSGSHVAASAPESTTSGVLLSDRATIIEDLRGQLATERERTTVPSGSVQMDRADTITQLNVARPLTTGRAAMMDRADTLQHFSDEQRTPSPLVGLDRADAIHLLRVASSR